jgi:hypothetical protein
VKGGGSKFCQSVLNCRGVAAEVLWSGIGITSFALRRANNEPWSCGGPLGEKGSESSGSPVVASTNKENWEGSLNESVGESQVCGLGRFETPSRIAELAMLLSVGKVRARGGVTS